MSAPQVFTRREIYDLVWSRPAKDLAADFGVSDVGLAKICNRYRIPKPGRGYWAKIQAGQKVTKALFREVNDPALNRIELRSGLRALPPAARDMIEKAKGERKAANPLPRRHLALAFTPAANVHPAIKRTAQVLGKATPDSRSR